MTQVIGQTDNCVVGTLKRRQGSAERVRKRRAAEARFKFYGVAAISIAAAALILLLGSIVSKGYTAFGQTNFKLSIYFDPEKIDPSGLGTPESLRKGDYTAIIRKSLYDLFPEARKNRRDRRALNRLVSGGADLELRRMAMADPSIVGTTRNLWVLASDQVDMFRKGYIARELAEDDRPLTAR